MSKNFQAFLKLNTKGLENQYVIIVNRKIVDRGIAIEKMLARVRKKHRARKIRR